MSETYPEKLEIVPLTQPPQATVRVPGSKSMTNRALILAALADEFCLVGNALRSDDTEVMVQALARLGWITIRDWARSRITVTGMKRAELALDDDWIPLTQAELFVKDSGTSMRFLTALVSLGKGTYRIDGSPQIRKRPMHDLLTTLQQLGVDAFSTRGNGCAPVVVNGRGLPGGSVQIRGDVSSQFLSALLLVCPFARSETTIEVEGPLVSEPYVLMTLAMLKAFGLKVTKPTANTYVIPGGQTHSLHKYTVEPDASSASYFWAAAAIGRGSVKVEGITAKSLQGDARFVDVLHRMGCEVHREESGTTVIGGPLHGIDVDMNDISDTAMTLAAVACFAEGPTTIRNVAHIRHKESDRLTALATELRRVGAGVEELADGLTILPAQLHGAEIETYNDHRMAMSMALIGLKVPGIVIKDPGCVAKTYPNFFSDLELLRRV